MDPAHSPIKILFTNGLNQGLICSMEQVSFIHSFPSIPLLHLLLLPETRSMNKDMHLKNIANLQSN